MENAANACVLAAVWFDHLESRNLVVVTVSEGIGTGTGGGVDRRADGRPAGAPGADQEQNDEECPRDKGREDEPMQRHGPNGAKAIVKDDGSGPPDLGTKPRDFSPYPAT